MYSESSLVGEGGGELRTEVASALGRRERGEGEPLSMLSFVAQRVEADTDTESRDVRGEESRAGEAMMLGKIIA